MCSGKFLSWRFFLLLASQSASSGRSSNKTSAAYQNKTTEQLFTRTSNTRRTPTKTKQQSNCLLVQAIQGHNIISAKHRITLSGQTLRLANRLSIRCIHTNDVQLFNAGFFLVVHRPAYTVSCKIVVE